MKERTNWVILPRTGLRRKQSLAAVTTNPGALEGNVSHQQMPNGTGTARQMTASAKCLAWLNSNDGILHAQRAETIKKEIQKGEIRAPSGFEVENKLTDSRMGFETKVYQQTVNIQGPEGYNGISARDFVRDDAYLEKMRVALSAIADCVGQDIRDEPVLKENMRVFEGAYGESMDGIVLNGQNVSSSVDARSKGNDTRNAWNTEHILDENFMEAGSGIDKAHKHNRFEQHFKTAHVRIDGGVLPILWGHDLGLLVLGLTVQYLVRWLLEIKREYQFNNSRNRTSGPSPAADLKRKYILLRKLLVREVLTAIGGNSRGVEGTIHAMFPI